MNKFKGLKNTLILLTLISVVCDTMILPFYPQFFLQKFGITSSFHVGSYIAACCFTVMLAFPLWAKLAKRIHELQLWIVTQLIAGSLGIACYFITDISLFWLITQCMFVFKASYLLIYPFVLRLEEKDQHLGIVGLFSVLMHFGGIGGAVLGGAILDKFDPSSLFLIMAFGDFIQVFICLFLHKKLKVRWQIMPAQASAHKRNKIPSFIISIGLISLFVYFSAFLARPYFALYWQQISQIDSQVLAGIIYAIPAWIALYCLYLNHRKSAVKANYQKDIAFALLIAACGLCLQGTSLWYLIVFDRCLLGYAMFIVTVKLEVLLFSKSEPSHYAEDFAKVHFMQNLGVIAASFTVGSLVTTQHYHIPFFVAASGFLITFLLAYFIYLRINTADPKSMEPSS
ncbi:MAG: MFS transporter [Alteromonadaceae bacterium]|nr:MFS transporter [Alteromonadaceae bacterium]